jgi:UDP-glucose 4-epimerase
MKTVLVTGGAGFIGSNLCARLVKEGYKVYSIDDYSTGSDRNHVYGHGVVYFTLSTVDINSLALKPDLIFHLGEYSRVEQSFGDMGRVWHSNSTGTFEVVEFARRTGAKLIYAGSSTKFGDNGADSSPYAFTKSKNTELVQNYGKWYGLDYAITYFYNAYGKNEIAEGPYATLIAKLARHKREGHTMTITSPGTQERNFTHVDDIVDGLVIVGELGKGDGWGIGSDEKFSVIEVAEMFGVDYEMGPEKAGNRLSAELKTSYLKALGWAPKRNLRDYVSGAINV